MKKNKNIQELKLGILGGGQLGRMFIENALRYNTYISVLDPSLNAPCSSIATHFVKGNFKEYDDVYNFGKSLDILTIEIEHVNVKALEDIETKGVRVYPKPKVVKTIQDKGLQKLFYKKNNIPSAPFRIVDNHKEIKKHKDFLPFFQKARKEGYDGKGVQKIETIKDLKTVLKVPSVLEKKVDITKELSVIVIVDFEGKTTYFPVVELVYNSSLNLVDYLKCPTEISPNIKEQAIKMAKKVALSFESPGIFAVELFLDNKNKLWVNETAPRTHNSGHHTIESCKSSQFDQQFRMLYHLPFGSTKSSLSAMVNLIGEVGHEGTVTYNGIEKIYGLESVYLHLYGKKITKPGRKMGHITILGDSWEEIVKKIQYIKENLKVISTP